MTWAVKRCIDGTFATATGSVGEDGSTGWYKFAMSQADTNGNNIGFNFTGTGAIPQTVNIVTDGSPPSVDVANIAGSAVSTSSAQIGVNVVNAGGTAWGSGAITAASIAADAITAAKVADGTIDAATFATGAITATAIAADAIGASELAADAATEIAAAVWDMDATGHQTGGTFGQAIGDPGADTNTIFKAVVTDATGATVGADTTSILDDTGTAGVIVATNNDKTGYALSAAGSAALTEGYPALQGTGTLPQLLYAILQHLEESSISGTTKTVKKRDQATSASTYTLDDANTPSSITRAT